MRLPGVKRRERIGGAAEPCCDDCGRNGTRCDDAPKIGTGPDLSQLSPEELARAAVRLSRRAASRMIRDWVNGYVDERTQLEEAAREFRALGRPELERELWKDSRHATWIIGGVHERRRARARARDDEHERPRGHHRRRRDRDGEHSSTSSRGHRRRRRRGGHLYVQTDHVGATYGGAAASSSLSVPGSVSEGGTYRPEASRSTSTRDTSPRARGGSSSRSSWNERRRARIGDPPELAQLDVAPELAARAAVALLPDRRAARRSLSLWLIVRDRSRDEIERCALELGLVGHPELADGLYRRPSTRRARSSASSSSWNERRRARIGQVFATDSGYQAAVDSLDRDWNGLAVTVCGTARGLLQCDTPQARELGAGWVEEFRATLGDWRTWRDDFRQRIAFWALDTNAEIDGWRAELERFRGDAARVTGTTATASPRQPSESPIEGIGRGVERVGLELARPVGWALAALVAILGLSFLRR